jgi:hypothetical protein
MSLIDFPKAATSGLLSPLVHGEMDGLIENLSQAERRDVRDMLDLIARRLAVRAEGIQHLRSRLDAVIASLIGIVDALDGDCDLEPTMAGAPSPNADDECEDVCEDEGAQCDDEGEPNDNGIGDYAGRDEQFARGLGLS